VLRLSEAVRGLACDLALIYGEEVALRDDGRSDFGALMAKRGGAQALLVAFDLLRLNRNDLRLRRFEERRCALSPLAAISRTSIRRLRRRECRWVSIHPSPNR
jgi:ATP-dependent DNA ligase